MKRAVVTVGLGFGDEGKGATVDYLCRILKADLVVRYSGGSQCAHNVLLPNGVQHTFCQFGSGTFAGANTYVGPQVIVYPEALRKEARNIDKHSLGSLDKITIHPRCLITTRYHRAANRLRELSRGADRHGSCGHGIGETRRYWLNYGDDAIYAEDLKDMDILREKLELLRQRMLMDLQSILPAVDSTEEAVFDLLIEEMANGLMDVFHPIKLKRTLPDYTTAIFEGAQGVLLDEYEGFHPHTTWSTVTARNAQELIAQSKPERVLNVGVIRGYTTRHGVGPFPTESKELTEVVNDKGNPWNEWQQEFRAGWLDLNLLHYAASVAGCNLDCITVNCMDHLKGTVMIGMKEEGFLRPNRKRLSESERQNELLKSQMSTSYMRASLKPCTADEILSSIGTIAPVAVVGKGPTWKDRTLTDWGEKNLR